MMYADDVVLCGETSGEVERLLEEWRVALKSGGMRISRTKTEYMRCTVTRRDRIPNARIKGTVKGAELSKKVQEARLRWYGHVLRRDEEGVERRIMDMEVQGRIGGEEDRRPGGRICLAADEREKQLDVGMVHNRNDWRQLIKNSSPI